MQTEVANHLGTLGTRILDVMARQQLTGMYFTFQQRQLLKRIDDREQLRRTLAKWGFGKVNTTGSEPEILEAIGRSICPSPKTMLLLTVLDIVFSGFPSVLYCISEFLKRSWES